MFNVHNLMPIQIQRFIDLQIYILIKIKDITTINIVLKCQLHLYMHTSIDLVN